MIANPQFVSSRKYLGHMLFTDTGWSNIDFKSNTMSFSLFPSCQIVVSISVPVSKSPHFSCLSQTACKISVMWKMFESLYTLESEAGGRLSSTFCRVFWPGRYKVYDKKLSSKLKLDTMENPFLNKVALDYVILYELQSFSVGCFATELIEANGSSESELSSNSFFSFTDSEIWKMLAFPSKSMTQKNWFL